MTYALILTTLAGLSTVLGGLIVIFLKKPTTKIVALSLGLAAGVMLTVSVFDMLPHAYHSFAEVYSLGEAVRNVIVLFVLGAVVAVSLQKLLPSEEKLLKGRYKSAQTAESARLAVVTVAVVMLHNLPEGVITLFSSITEPDIGLTLALAIALHNIPEGIVVSIPVYVLTKSKTKAILACLISGLSEPIGALIAYYFLQNILTPLFVVGLLAVVAGIMVTVSIMELLPAALKHGETKNCVAGVVIGVIIMSMGIFLI